MIYGNRNIDGPKVKKMFIIQEIENYTSKRTIFQMNKSKVYWKSLGNWQGFLAGGHSFPGLISPETEGPISHFFASSLWWTDFKMALIIPPSGTQALVKASPFECGQDLWLHLINYSKSNTMGRCGSQVPTAPDSSSKTGKKRMLSQWLPSSKEGKWTPCHPRGTEIAQVWN